MGGLRSLYDELRGAGLSDQAAMSTIHTAGQHAKACHHTPLSEATETRGGRIVFRSAAAHQRIAIGEENKVDPLKIGRSQTRLGIGENGSHHRGNDAYIMNRARRIMRQRDTSRRIQMTGDQVRMIAEPGYWPVFIREVQRVHGREGVDAVRDLFREEGLPMPRVPRD